MKNTPSFIHLHTHTEYCFLDSTIRIDDLVETAKKFGMEAISITDHGGLFGAMEFNYQCVRKGIKPIFGMEAYIAPGSRFDKCPIDHNHHVLTWRCCANTRQALSQHPPVSAVEPFPERSPPVITASHA